ncbi:hypothetical protein G6F64_015234 [Rhizopus arrhizus]|uniref:Uncharacterized protein n=1 Tax=Rhizopus oryzae TaxID=64495 RepID=A0A9P6WRY5_RHIOR|nr:hypothetical protein G6F24_018603 [Rhizopus arrhizus]KAG1273959.1 hypothetical protein G6F64_015234 [Rhizopus arrhizus]
MSSPNAWNVPIHIAAAATGLLAAILSHSSLAALLEKVSTRIVVGSTPSASNPSMRRTSVRVLPVPGPACS